MAALLLAVVLACARTTGSNGTAEEEQVNRIDPALRRLAGVSPDSVVGAFLRLSRDPTARDLEELRQAGIRPGAITGRLLSARGAAGTFLQVARIPFVEYIQLSRPARTQPPESRARRSPTSGGSE